MGHVCGGVIGSQEDVELNILTGHPERWQSSITVTDKAGKHYVANINRVSSKPEEVVRNQDIILICLPGYLIEKTLRDIRPYVGDAAVGTVVSSTGFFFFAHTDTRPISWAISPVWQLCWRTLNRGILSARN